MNILSWNCRGLNSSSSPTIPYLRWLVSQYHPTFLFLQETKSSVHYVNNLLQATNPRYSFGVDAQNLSGGLVVFCWGPYDVQLVALSTHYVFCKVIPANGKIWQVLFLYGEPRHHLRRQLWLQLFTLLSDYDTYLIIGDINQLDNYQDKIGGAPVIRGWEDINQWKLDLKSAGCSFHWSPVYLGQ